MKFSKLIAVLPFILLFACVNDNSNADSEDLQEIGKTPSTVVDEKTKTEIEVEKKNKENNAEATDFSHQGFDNKVYYELLIESRLCDPNFDPENPSGATPCSAKFFKFFPYNHKREIDNAFMVQLKAGVNNFPYRRLLIFVREKGELILMNGIVGYLVERIPTENEIDDLIVAVIDDLGNDQFDRYDVLLRYKNGKYHFIEAVGDLQGEFDTQELKERASKAIEQRIQEKELIF